MHFRVEMVNIYNNLKLLKSMKKIIKTLSIILTLSISAIAVAQTPPPATPTCPALERLNAGTARTKDCTAITGNKAKCRW